MQLVSGNQRLHLATDVEEVVLDVLEHADLRDNQLAETGRLEGQLLEADVGDVAEGGRDFPE